MRSWLKILSQTRKKESIIYIYKTFIYICNYNVNKTSLASRAKPSVSYSSAMSSNSNGKLLPLIIAIAFSLIGE